MARAAPATASPPSRPRRTAPASVLWTSPGTTALSASGPPIASATSPASDGPAAARAHEGDPVVPEELGHLRGREPVPAGENGAGHQGRRPLRAGVGELGDAPGGLAAPPRVPRDARQRARRPLGVLVHRGRALAARGAGGLAVGRRHQHGEDRHAGAQPVGGRAHLRGDLAADPAQAGLDVDDDHGVGDPGGGQHLEGLPELRGGGGGEQIDRVADRRLRGGDLPQARPDRLGKLHDVQAVLLAGVRAEDPGPAGVGEDRRPGRPPAAAGSTGAWRGRRARSACRPDHPRLLEERVDGRRRSRRPARRCASRPRAHPPRRARS